MYIYVYIFLHTHMWGLIRTFALNERHQEREDEGEEGGAGGGGVKGRVDDTGAPHCNK